MTPFNELAPAWMVRLMTDLSLTAAQAAGILGNLAFESGEFKSLHEIGQPVGKGGYGVAQWTGPRRAQFLDWCKSHEMDWTSDEANYGFLIEELLSTQAKSLAQLRKATAVEAAVFTFGYWFERPGGTTKDHLPGYDARLGYALRALSGVDLPQQPVSVVNAIDRIKAIQVVLGVKPDGAFGPNSRAALDALLR